ncbi:MAG: hypothetical protein FRX49_11245 [Trebouxia sp. A1-2]|nr:MAG: hypothetical protein FRX49_11245 [Trebouxia sp. A1-2]
MESQLEAVRQEIRSAKDEIVEVKQELAIAKQAGNKGGEKEVRFLRGRLEKLDSQMLSLNEKENILLRSQAPGKFTLKNLISRPFPPLDARLSSRSSNSKTILSAPRTFEDILPWPQLLLQARELEDSLDDTLHLYDNISFTYTPNLAISSAADECEVRSSNDAANILGIGAVCIGGGSERSLSFTDLVVRKRTHSSNNKHVSSLVLGVGEGYRQLVFATAKVVVALILLACSQVYGDAVIDEAPLLFVSNYHSTVFLKRSERVCNKQRWASDPIWWDRQQPSARSCWLTFLRLADEKQVVKARLPRTAVPRTADSYVLTQVSSKDRPLATKRSVRTRSQPAIKLMASSSTRKGYEAFHDKAASSITAGRLQQQPFDTATGLDTMPSNVIVYKLAVHRQQGAVAGETCAVKLYDSRRNESVSAYFHEKCCLQALQTRASVVRFMVAGRLQDTVYPVTVTSFAGKPVSNLSRAQFRAAKEALDSVHAIGVCHGDIRRSNIIFALDFEISRTASKAHLKIK